MKGTGPERQVGAAASASGSELLAATPASQTAASRRSVPRGPNPAAVIRALAPTVADWMPGQQRASNVPAPFVVHGRSDLVSPASAPSLQGGVQVRASSSPPPSLPVEASAPQGFRMRHDAPVSAVVERPAPAAPAAEGSSPELPPTERSDESLAAVGLKPGDLVDRTYRIEKTLGVGGMGVVALAHDERLDRRVAIKLIKPELFAFPDMRTFFDNEARAMARVSHPNVVHVYAFGEHGAVPYFVMEYVEGKTVEHWLRARPEGVVPDLDEAVRILDQACLGVEAIHASHTVHRDIKPSNLLLEPNGRVRVGDLGVARILESESSNVVVGSALYMAPEAALAEEEASELAARRDIYALGCLAYELFTGRPPFVGATDMNVLSQHVLQEPAPPSAHRPDLPPGYDEILLRALAKDPHKRYPTVGAFRRALLAEHSGTREPERILIADDDPDWREIISSSLTSRFPHAQIDEVGDGVAALSAFESQLYSVVLVDLEMPEMDGARLTAALRSLDASQRTPIIVLTAAGGPKEWQRLSAIGADAFLVKPVNADDVELLIRRTLRSRHTAPPSQSEARLPAAPPPPPSNRDYIVPPSSK
jgi:serine/threonine-protein kinase